LTTFCEGIFGDKETNNANEHSKVENHNWWKADQLPAYKHSSGAELGTTKKQIHQVFRERPEPRTSRFQIWYPEQSAMLLLMFESKIILKCPQQVKED